MARAFASGQIAFGLVSIPVKLFSATEASERISFNQLHRECGNRIQQQLFCPKDERTITRDEIVKGFEFSKGQYVLFSDEELKNLEEKSTQQIDITEFLPKTEVDPIYFSKAFYLAPDKGGARAYTLFSKALEQTGRWALAKYAARGKQYLVIIRPLDNGLVMQQLYYPNEIRSMADLDLGDAVVKENELKMAVQLAEMSASDEFHPENYRDEVQERIRAVIQQKVEGEEVTITAEEEPKAQVIDLMEALRKSLGSAPPARSSSRSSSSNTSSAPAANAAPAKPTRLPVKPEAKRKPAKAAPAEPHAAKAAAGSRRAR